MQVLMMIVQLFQRTTIAYGKLFLLFGTIIEEGGNVLKATLEVLGQEKYKHIKAHFQAGVLHLIAAASEFKKGGKALETALAENSEDFKVLVDFKAKMKKDIPKALGECFKGIEEIAKGFDFEAKVPAFIRESGEYMDLVNQGCVEVDEKTFKEIMVKDHEGIEESLIQALVEAQESIEVKGWAEYVTIEHTGTKKVYHRHILWADSFNFDGMIPAWVKPVEKQEDLGYSVEHIRAGGKIYRVPVLRRMTPQQVEELKADPEAFIAKQRKEQDDLRTGGWDRAPGRMNPEEPQ